MNRNTGSAILLALLLIGGALLWMKLETTSVQSQTSGINNAVRQVDPDSASKASALERVAKLGRRTSDKIKAEQAEFDSLMQANPQ
jgi:hypothetical protein